MFHTERHIKKSAEANRHSHPSMPCASLYVVALQCRRIQKERKIWGLGDRATQGGGCWGYSRVKSLSSGGGGGGGARAEGLEPRGRSRRAREEGLEPRGESRGPSRGARAEGLELRGES